MKKKIFTLSISLIFIFPIFFSPVKAQECKIETSQADFQASSGTNIDLTSSPGDIVLNAVLLDQQNGTVGTTSVGISPTSWGCQTFTPAISGKTCINFNQFILFRLHRNHTQFLGRDQKCQRWFAHRRLPCQ